MRYKFPMLLFDFYTVEIFAYYRHPARIAHQKYFMRQFFWPQVKMINGTPGINDQFTFFYTLHFCRSVRQISPNILLLPISKGSVAERLGRALQKLLQQFESARNLHYFPRYLLRIAQPFKFERLAIVAVKEGRQKQ